MKQFLLRNASLVVFVIFLLMIGFWLVSDDIDTSNSQTEQRIEGTYAVTRVYDGDTIAVDVDGQTETIRLIGIDAAEIQSPYSEAECFGNESREYARSLLADKVVRLEADESQDNRDDYDRLLRYVYLDDTNINYQLVLEGYAHEYTYRDEYSNQAMFRAAEQQAQQQQNGLWADGACSDFAPEPSQVDDDQLNAQDSGNWQSSIPDGCVSYVDAERHIGQQTCVTGPVDHVFVSATDTTFVNYCSDYRSCPFSVVLFSDDKADFPAMAQYEGSVITIFGEIRTYEGRPQIILENPSQLRQ